jgi:hypothetical protein
VTRNTLDVSEGTNVEYTPSNLIRTLRNNASPRVKDAGITYRIASIVLRNRSRGAILGWLFAASSKVSIQEACRQDRS